MPFSKVCGFLRSKMAAYEELLTPIYTLFCRILTIGKTTMGYKTLLEQIKTVCAWNSLKTFKSDQEPAIGQCMASLFWTVFLLVQALKLLITALIIIVAES